MRAVLNAVAYPFKRAGALLVGAVLIGELPYSGLAPSLFVLSFAIPVVLDSARGGGDSSLRLAPTMPGLGPALGAGLALHLVYLGPSLLIHALAYIADEYPALQVIMPLTMLPLVLQVALFIFWPAAVAVLVLEGNPLPAFARQRVLRMAAELGSAYGGIAAYVLLCGGTVVVLQDSLTSLGRIGWIGVSALVAWFWIVGLHLVGRALRSRGKLEAAAGED